MSFVFNEAELQKESEEFYSTYPVDVSEIENELNQRYEKEKVSAMVQKKWTYEAICTENAKSKFSGTVLFIQKSLQEGTEIQLQGHFLQYRGLAAGRSERIIR